MKQLNLQHVTSKKGYSVFAVLLAGATSLLPVQAAAEDWRFKGTVFSDRNAENLNEDGRLDLRTRIGALLEASRNFNLQDGHRANLGFTLGSDVYPEYSSMNRYDFGVNGEYIAPLSYGIFKQFRLAGEFTHSHSERGTVFNRPRLGMAVRLEPAKRNTLQLRARFGYRDHNDQLLAGYDQFEWLADVMHLWTSEDRSFRTTSFFYVEGRKAKANKFDYTEVGFRFIGRKSLSETRELIGRVSGHVRDYTHTARYDQKFRATLGHMWKFQHAVELEAYAGFERNISTQSDKDYGGALLGLSISKEF